MFESSVPTREGLIMFVRVVLLLQRSECCISFVKSVGSWGTLVQFHFSAVAFFFFSFVRSLPC